MTISTTTGWYYNEKFLSSLSRRCSMPSKIPIGKGVSHEFCNVENSTQWHEPYL